jgi:fatty-acyl-CoA synthase
MPRIPAETDWTTAGAGSITLNVDFGSPRDLRRFLARATFEVRRLKQPSELQASIICRYRHVFSGYLDPRHNNGLWIDIDGERWLNTGDLGRRDANGYFWLAGRKKELIIRGGHNIDPKIIEDALQSHPAVAVVAAIGSPDAYAGELPVAYVQLKPGLVVTEAELIEHAAQTIPEKAAVPLIAMTPISSISAIRS